MKYILGIDQSFTSSGICIMDMEENIVLHETINTTDADGDIFDRCLKVIDRLDELALMFRPVRIGLEGLAFSKFGNATRDLAGLQAAIVTHLRYRKPNQSKNLEIISPNLLKKYATGSGSADKNKMYDSLPAEPKAVYSAYKKTKGRSDVVDAYWIAKYTLEAFRKHQTILDKSLPSSDADQTSSDKP